MILNKKSVLIGIISQGLQYLSLIILLGFMLDKLSNEELGIWYVFLTISGLLGMLDLGFSPSIFRNMSYAIAGTDKLMENGYSTCTKGVNYKLASQIVIQSKKMFLLIAVFSTIFALTVGTIYMSSLVDNLFDNQQVLISWGLFIVAIFINIRYKFYTPLIQGMGLMYEYYKSIAISNIVLIFISVTLLEFGYKLIAVSAAFLISSIVNRIITAKYFNSDMKICNAVRSFSHDSTGLGRYFKTIWKNSWRLGLSSIGAFLTLKVSTLFCASYLGLELTASYALTIQISSAIAGLSSVVFNLQLPEMNKSHISLNVDNLRKIILTGLFSAVAIYISLSLLFINYGFDVISFFSDETKLLSYNLTLLILFMLFLEMIHTLSGGILVSGNEVPFTESSILSGLAIVLLVWLGLNYLDMGIYWVIACQFFVQLSYNNWRWPLEVRRMYFKEG